MDQHIENLKQPPGAMMSDRFDLDSSPVSPLFFQEGVKKCKIWPSSAVRSFETKQRIQNLKPSCQRQW